MFSNLMELNLSQTVPKVRQKKCVNACQAVEKGNFLVLR